MRIWETEQIKQLYKDEDKVISFMGDLPVDTDTSYTKEIIRLVVNNPPSIKDVLYRILINHINDNDDCISFAAFYGLVVYFRRYKIFSELERIASIYGNQFGDKPLFYVAMCTIYRNKGSELDLQIAIEYATRALDKCNNHQGILQTYADTIAYALEQGYNISNELLEKALHCVNDAIIIDSNYPKYYCTIGRLLTYKNEYTQAKRYILKAIDLEDSSQTDYAMRIADYQNYLQRCYTNESVHRINISVNEALKQITNSKSRLEEQIEKEKITYLEFLGFFTAIISFVLTTIHLSINFEIIEAAALIIMLLGVLIIAMIIFSILTGIRKKSGWLVFVLIIIGISCLVIGISIAFLYVNWMQSRG